MELPRLNDVEGVIHLLRTVASFDGDITRDEEERIERIRRELEQLSPRSAFGPAMLLALVFDVAIADGRLDDAEEHFLAELAAASDWSGVTLASLIVGWKSKRRYNDLMKKSGLLSLDERKYSIGHAAADICSALRRSGATDIRIHTSRDAKMIGITGTNEDGLGVAASTEFLGLGAEPARDGLLTRSAAALELHIAAAGSLVAESTAVISVHGEDIAVASSFGRKRLPRVASLSGLEWAGRVAKVDSSEFCILLEGVEGVEGDDWRRAVFDELVRVVDRRLHRWGAKDCPGGPVNLWVNRFLATHGAADPFRRDLIPRRFPRRLIEPRPGLILDVRAHQLVPLEIALARRISVDQEVVRPLGVVDGLARGLPTPGVFLYDDLGRCILSEYIPENIARGGQMIQEHRVRIDVVERPRKMQSIDCLNFSSVWEAIRQCIVG